MMRTLRYVKAVYQAFAHRWDEFGHGDNRFGVCASRQRARVC